MAKIVCHAEKQKSDKGGLLGMPHHIDRIGVYDKDGKVIQIPHPKKPDVMISKYPQIRYPENHKWNRGSGASYSEFTNEWEKAIEKIGGRKPQCNASPTVCFNNSAGEVFWELLRKNYPKDEDYYAKCEEYFSDFREMLIYMYPDAPILKWASHYEELRPHQHVLMPCITRSRKRLNTKNKPKPPDSKKSTKEDLDNYNKELEIWKKDVLEPWLQTGKVLKFSSGEFLGGRDGLELLQDMAFKYLGEKWGLERGDRGSAARHTDQAGWQVELNKKDKDLKGKDKSLKIREEAIEGRETIVTKKEIAVMEREKNIKVKEAKVEQLLKDAEEVKKKADAEAKNIKATAWKSSNNIVKAAEKRGDEIQSKMTQEQKDISEAQNINLAKADVPLPEKSEKAISYYERIKGWIKGFVSRLTKKEKDLAQKEAELNSKTIRVDAELDRLVGNHGEENMILQAINLLKNKLKEIQIKKNNLATNRKGNALSKK